jgi:hypothetical protein
MKMTENGVTTLYGIGKEHFEPFTRRIGRKVKEFIQYDYRHIDGQLFSCVKPTLKECVEARNKWIEKVGTKSYDEWLKSQN